MSAPTPSSRIIDAAVRRVDAIRALEQDLSTSDNVGADADSANEIENALTVLARRRLPLPPESAQPAKRRKKTTGLMRIFNLAG